MAPGARNLDVLDRAVGAVEDVTPLDLGETATHGARRHVHRAAPFSAGCWPSAAAVPGPARLPPDQRTCIPRKALRRS